MCVCVCDPMLLFSAGPVVSEDFSQEKVTAEISGVTDRDVRRGRRERGRKVREGGREGGREGEG